MSYEQIAEQLERRGAPRDLAGVWEELTPLEDAAPEVRARVERFAETKRLTLEALEAIGTRLSLRGRGPDIVLAWAAYGRVAGRRTRARMTSSALGQLARSASGVLLPPRSLASRWRWNAARALPLALGHSRSPGGRQGVSSRMGGPRRVWRRVSSRRMSAERSN